VSETIEDVRKLIESRLAEISVEASDLERALAGFRDGSAARPRRSGRGRTLTRAAAKKAAPAMLSTKTAPKPRTTPRRKGPKRAARGERREQLLAAIAASPGARPSELAQAIDIRPTQVSVLIAKLRGERLIVKSGKGYALKS
jgi:hypothetical protein